MPDRLARSGNEPRAERNGNKTGRLGGAIHVDDNPSPFCVPAARYNPEFLVRRAYTHTHTHLFSQRPADVSRDAEGLHVTQHCNSHSVNYDTRYDVVRRLYSSS